MVRRNRIKETWLAKCMNEDEFVRELSKLWVKRPEACRRCYHSITYRIQRIQAYQMIGSAGHS